MSKEVNFFNRHLTETGENYFEHFLFAFSTAMWLLYAALILLVHAIMPFFFTVSASKHIRRINQIMQKRLEILFMRRDQNKQNQTN